MKVTVDRFEGDRAIVDFGGELVEVPLAALPPGTKEGWTLQISSSKPDLSEAEARIRRMTRDLPDDMEL